MSKIPYDIFKNLGSIPGKKSIPAATAVKNNVRKALKRKYKKMTLIVNSKLWQTKNLINN